MEWWLPGVEGWVVLCCLSCLAVVGQDAGSLNAFPAGYLSGVREGQQNC